VQQQNSICDFPNSDSWVILSPIEQSIKRKIEAVGTPLKDWDIQINYGIKTGYNDAFIISTEKREEILANCKTEDERKRTDELIRPILRGRDIKRYGYEWANLYLIATFPARHYDIDKYPAVKKYLLSFAESYLRDAGYDWVADNYLGEFCMQKLAQTGKFVEIKGERITIGKTPEKARKKTSNKWFETQDSISYWEDFNKPKIVWGEISDRSKFAYESGGKFIPEATTFLMVGSHLPYLFCALNSPISEWFFSKVGTTTGVGTVRWKKYTILQLLLPSVSEKQQEKFSDFVKQYIEGSIPINKFAKRVNEEIYHLVGLSESEVNYVENFYPPLN
jgi:hypothetical protein